MNIKYALNVLRDLHYVGQLEKLRNDHNFCGQLGFERFRTYCSLTRVLATEEQDKEIWICLTRICFGKWRYVNEI